MCGLSVLLGFVMDISNEILKILDLVTIYHDLVTIYHSFVIIRLRIIFRIPKVLNQ